MRTLAPERVEALLDACRGVRVLVVGDLMLDRYISGTVDRISPEAPVPVVRVEEEFHAVGGAANVAANVVALGARCEVVGSVGADEGAELLRGDLRDAGVSTGGLVETRDRPTAVKIRVLARRQQIVRVDREVDTDASPELAGRLVDAALERLDDCDVVAFEDYNKGVLVPDVVSPLLAEARRRGLPSVVDPKRLRFFAYGGATVFKPNAKELADALGEHIHPDRPDWMEATRARLHCEHLLLTLGENGVALRTADGEDLRVPAVARSVYDVSGAGDTVTAVVSALVAAGATVPEAAVLANHAAAIEVGKAGVSTVTPAELSKHYMHFIEEDSA